MRNSLSSRMRNSLSSRIVACGILIGGLLAAPVTTVHAQGLYRVELVVFASAGGGDSEQWEALPELAYPASVRVLIDPNEPRGMPTTLGNTTVSVTTSDPGTDGAPVAPGEAATYVLLPANERELGAAAAAMQRSGRYRILFHEAWIQPIPAQSAALPIVLDRPADGSAWPELQGTIALYQAGDYLLETNLWLNTQGEYLPGTWRMPAPPRGRNAKSLAVTQPSITAPASHAPELSTASALEAVVDYPYRHAIPLRQTRRIRAGEVFYVDHPMLGVAIKISSPEASTTAPPGAAHSPRRAADALGQPAADQFTQ